MKKLLPFSGFVAAILGVVAIVMMFLGTCVYASTTVTVMSTSVTTTVAYSAILGLFGGSGTVTTTITGVGSNVTNVTDGKAIVGAIIAFILLIIGVLAAVFAGVLPLIDKKYGKIAGFVGLGAVLFLLVGGVLVFFEKSFFTSVYEVSADSVQYYHLGTTYIISGIVAILAAVVAVLPALSSFVSKN